MEAGPEGRPAHITVHSGLLAALLRDELRCGARPEDASVPAALMAGPASVRRALLGGLLRNRACLKKPRAHRRGDGEDTHGEGAISVGADASSPVLRQQAVLLLQGEGLIPACREHEMRVPLTLRERQAQAFARFLAGRVLEFVPAFRVDRARVDRARAAPLNLRDYGNYATAEVVAVERVEPGPVFSMEVEGDHTFVTSFGIAVHNCIPIDPFYLTWIAKKYGFNTRFIELAGEVNTSMPAYVVSRVADALNDRGKPVKGSRVLLLGMAYKKDVDDPRESPGFELLDLLLKKGAAVDYNDPHIPSLPKMRHWPHLKPMESVALTPESLAAYDCVLIATDHSAYDYDFVVKHSRLVVDTRNATKKVSAGREKIVKA